MEIRRLEQAEHGRTRGLYEQVFPEDSQAFVEYYYTWKTKDNVIYAAEDEKGIHAMLHLNPFLVSVNGKIQKLHYIVAVATRKEYRHKGLMSRLLQLAEQEMAQAGEAFTFLMPASEKIYLPFGYRFFGWQRKGILRPQAAERNGLAAAEVPKTECRPAKPQEYEALARFVNGILETQYEVFIHRDRAYYERLCAEQQCQGGNVMVLVQDGRIIGTFCTAAEEQDSEYAFELREIIAAEEYESEAGKALQEYVNCCGICRVTGCQAGIPLECEVSEPLMMGKVPGDGIFCSDWSPERIFINEVV